MHTFVLCAVPEINENIKIFKLSVDGFIAYDELVAKVKKDGNFKRELNNVQTILEQYAKTWSLPPTKFKELNGCRDAYTEYEIKTRNLRVYFFKLEKTGSIILWGGNKNSQKKDITIFRRMKREFIEKTNRL